MANLKDKIDENIKNPQLKDFQLNWVHQKMSPVNAVGSEGTLTMDTQPTVGDTMTIGNKTYTFTTDGTAAADGEIDVGADLADAKTLVPAAINGTDGINTAHTQVTAAAFVGDNMVVTASTMGVSGDLIATTETFTAATNVFDAATLGTTTAGVDGTPGTKGQMCFDDSYHYYCRDNMDKTGDKWVRESYIKY